jgi:hypothetical protein
MEYEGYSLGSKVWAIGEYHIEGKASEYVVIVPAFIKDANFAQQGDGQEVTYLLRTPEGKDWGDSLDESLVFGCFADACDYMQIRWSQCEDYR